MTLGAQRCILYLMKTTTTASKKQIVTEYAALIKKAEKAWDTEEVTRLLVERNERLG